VKNLYHHGDNESKASKLTQAARWSGPTARWLCATQVWSWEGGDAIVVVTGRFPSPTVPYVVLRIGDKIHHVADASLHTAMQAFGLNPKDYQIVAGA